MHVILPMRTYCFRSG